MMLKRYSTFFLLWFCFAILSSNGLLCSCATLKQKFSKKERHLVSLSQQEALKEQSAAMEHKERELIKYFGSSVTLLLNDGFRFHPDSGLMGSSALLEYRSSGMAMEREKDSVSTEHFSETHRSKDVLLKTEEIEKQKSKSISNWWLLVLLPVFWVIWRLRFLNSFQR